MFDLQNLTVVSAVLVVAEVASGCCWPSMQ